MLGWVFFRAADLAHGMRYLSALAGLQHPQAPAALVDAVVLRPLPMLVMLAGVLLVFLARDTGGAAPVALLAARPHGHHGLRRRRDAPHDPGPQSLSLFHLLMSSRSLASFVTVLFLALLAAVPVADHLGRSPAGFDWPRACARLREARSACPDVFSAVLPWLPPGSAFEELERDLEASSWLRAGLRPRVQGFLTARLGLGNAAVIVGSDDWLFHRPSVEYVIGDAFGPTPGTTLADWGKELERAGIELVVLPVPAKASACPDELGAGVPHPVHNPGWAPFLEELRRGGVAVVDPTPVLRDAYLRTDSHWTPEAVEAVAALVAEEVLASGRVERGPRQYPVSVLEIERVGDLGRLLDERGEVRWLAPDTVTVRSVRKSDGRPWEPDPAAPGPAPGGQLHEHLLALRDGVGNGRWPGRASQRSTGIRRRLPGAQRRRRAGEPARPATGPVPRGWRGSAWWSCSSPRGSCATDTGGSNRPPSARGRSPRRRSAGDAPVRGIRLSAVRKGRDSADRIAVVVFGVLLATCAVSARASSSRSGPTRTYRSPAPEASSASTRATGSRTPSTRGCATVARPPSARRRCSGSASVSRCSRWS